MKITIGASRNATNALGSEAIQWWLNTDYSHVYVRWFLNDQKREIVYQASQGSCHFLAFNNFTINNIIVKEFNLELTTEQFQEFSAKCVDLAGQKYSKLELIQILLSDLSKGRLKFKDQPGYICSELMAELLIGLGYLFNKPLYLITPKDIVVTLENGPLYYNFI